MLEHFLKVVHGGLAPEIDHSHVGLLKRSSGILVQLIAHHGVAGGILRDLFLSYSLDLEANIFILPASARSLKRA